MPALPVPCIKLKPQPPEADLRSLAAELGLPPLVAALAWQRGLRDLSAWKSFRVADPGRQHDPRLLPDMDAAVERLLFAREHGQRVLIHGDYDVDGLTGSAVLLRALLGLGMDAHAFVPQRKLDGYGLARRALENALANDCALVVTVDCGSSEGEIIEEMALRGLETIVTDHHLATDLPQALAFVSPMRSDSSYPFRDLCGSAIAYKLARALYEALGRGDSPATWLDFVALGTVADVMPLRGENLILVRAGLEEMSRRLTSRRGSREDIHPAWRALARSSGMRPGEPGEVNAQDLAFRFSPRLNAPGRLGSPKLSLDLLTCDDPAEADRLARSIEDSNLERRRVEAEITSSARAAALARLERDDAPGVLVLADHGWHPGVLGISASRLVDEFDLPVLLGGIDAEGVIRGSGRAGEGRDLKALLDGAADFLTRHGGHKRAVGFTLEAENWDAFAERVESLAPPAGKPEPCIGADLSVEAEDLDRAFLDALETLGPFGEGNPEPVFLLKGIVPRGKRIIKEQHLRVDFESRRGGRFRSIAFGGAAKLSERVEIGAETDLCVRVARDTFQKRPGEHGVALHLLDFAPGSGE